VKREYNEHYHKDHYTRKGYNQKGSANNNWVSGIGAYRHADLPKECNRCGSDKFLCVHHKDGNRHNNEISNLERLCKRCHQISHGCIDVLPKDGEHRRKFLAETPDEVVRDSLGRFKPIDHKV
jgi:hypothetical protein